MKGEGSTAALSPHAELPSAASSQAQARGGISKNPHVRTDFLPDREREAKEEQLRQELRTEYELRQQVQLSSQAALASNMLMHRLLHGLCDFCIFAMGVVHCPLCPSKALWWKATGGSLSTQAEPALTEASRSQQAVLPERNTTG